MGDPLESSLTELRENALQVAKKAALLAGEHALKIRKDESFKVSLKGDRDLVTEADLECEKIILKEIHSHFPDHQILSEETSTEMSEKLHTGPLWVIDPIDGTTSFAHGHIHFGVSIAFVFDGKREAAVVNCPALNELYTAIKGGGAYCNGESIKASSVTEMKNALICTGFPYQREYLDGIIHRITGILRACRDMRRLGAASVDICWVASGKIDGFYEDLMPWDVAAGLLIAEEAGAKITRFTEKNTDYQALKTYKGDVPEGALPDEIDGTNLVVSAPGIEKEFVQTLAFLT